MAALPRKIVMATGNPGKLREIRRILAEFDIEIVPQSEYGVSDADETGTTFAENALIKARHAVEATGLPAIADDSGLAVDALNGRPGVYSSRYAGSAATDDQNNDKLLGELDGVPYIAMQLIDGDNLQEAGSRMTLEQKVVVEWPPPQPQPGP